jgi:hypothetical protein
MNRRPKDLVLISGGSHGIGRALALECLNRGLSVAILALADRHLSDIVNEVNNPDFFHLGINLTDENANDQVATWLEENNLSPKYLINNVGFGRGGLFESIPLREYQLMMTLNNQVLVNLTYLILPYLKANQGGILNLSSMEARLPLPYKTVYTGTKAFIYNLSLALREEFRYHNVGVSVLCPGPILTNEDGLKRVKAQGAKAKLILKMPEDIAPEAIDGLLSNKATIFPGWLPKVLIRIAYFLPEPLLMKVLEKTFRNYRDNPSEVVSSDEVVKKEKTTS